MAETTNNGSSLFGGSIDWLKERFRESEPSAISVSAESPEVDLDKVAGKFAAESAIIPSGDDNEPEVTSADLDKIVTKFKAESPKVKPVENDPGKDFSSIRQSFREKFPDYKDYNKAGDGAVSKVNSLYKNDSAGEVIGQATEGLTTVFKGAAANVSPADSNEGASGFRKGSTYDIVSEVGHGLGEAILNIFTGTGGTHLKRVATDTQRGLVRDNVSRKDRGLEG